MRLFDEVGLDVSVQMWTFRYRLRGGAAGDLRISGRDHDRLWSLVQQSSHGFIVFSSCGRYYAINLNHLLFCQFLFDPPYLPDVEESEIEYTIQFHLADGGEPICLSVDPDHAELVDDPDHGAQLQALFVEAETLIEGALSFLDEDGEQAFFLAKDVSMFSTSLVAVEPSLLDVEDDPDEEEAGLEVKPLVNVSHEDNIRPFPRSPR